MKLSLKSQITILLVAVVAVLTTLLTTLTIDRMRTQMAQAEEHKAVLSASILAAGLAQSLAQKDYDGVAQVTLGTKDDLHRLAVNIFDAKMEPVYTSTEAAEFGEKLDKCNYVDSVEVRTDGSICYVEHPIYYRGEQVGCLWLAMSEEHMASEFAGSVRIVIAGAVVLMILAALGGVVVTGRLLRPMQTFEQAALRISSGDLSTPVATEHMPIDFAGLAAAFNRMQNDLAQAIDRLEESRNRLEDDVNERTRALMLELEERRRAELTAAESQDLLRATLESTDDAILVVNREGSVTHANAKFAEFWKIPNELMSAQDDDLLLAHVLDQLVDPDAFLAKVMELYESSDRSLDVLNFKDGRTFERYSCPLVRHGRNEGRVWSFRDISERVRTLDALHQSQQKLFLHFQQSPVGVIEWDLEARVTQWNPSAERIFGYSRAEAVGRHARFIVPEKDHCRIDAIWRALVANTAGARKTNDNVTKDGRLLTCEWYRTPLIDDSGQVVGVASLVQDITERQRAAIAQSVLLRVSEAANFVDSVEDLLAMVWEYLTDLIDTTNFYIALYDGETGLFSFPFIRDQFTGSENPPVDMTGSLTSYVYRTEKPLLADPDTFRRLLESGEVRQVGPPTNTWLGVPLKTPTGTIGVMAVQDYRNPNAFTTSDLDWLMSISSAIGRVIERKRAQLQEIELRDQLERAERMRALGVLAGGVAHDLNNMLGPLVGYPDLMLTRLEEGNPLRRQVEQIGVAARQAAGVVQDLLTLARRGRYSMVPLDLNEIISEYLDTPSFANLRDTHGNVSVALDLDREIRPVLGSSPHLSKVVMNLVVNAFDAMPQGGRMTITSRQSYIESLPSGYAALEPGEYIVMSVKDTGIGIDADDIDKIFEPYYSKKKMGVSGSGLGLSVVYGVVKDHCGYYDIISRPGEGTEFLIIFPIATDDQIAPVAEEPARGGSESILVVDDNDGQRLMATELIASLGYRTTAVASGHQAVELAKEQRFDLVIIDMIMETDFDGLDTYSELIKYQPKQKAVIVSGYSSTLRVLQMQALGAGPYVKKPYTRQAIATAIRATLDNASVDQVESESSTF
jgi:PAS domain S-box-containing protein